MAIVDVGTDIVEIDRIQVLLDKYDDGFRKRFFTETERQYCDAKARPAIHYAGRFAVKESVIKILGAQVFAEMEVVNRQDGKPLLVLRGLAKSTAEQRNVKAIHISISHSRDNAIAIAVAQ